MIGIFISLSAAAQTNEELDTKITNLETRLTTMQSSLADMQRKVDEVTKQNLALKSALHLQPTIAEQNANGIVYKLIEAKGDSVNSKIVLTFSVNNNTDNDINVQFENIEVIDELGNMCSSIHNRQMETFLGRSSCHSITTLYPDTPVKMKLEIPISEEMPQYVKLLDGKLFKKQYSFRMSNIPIKWK